MIVVTRVDVRPSTSVAFHAWLGVISHISQNFTGKVLSRSTEVSTDLLSMTHTMIFADQSAKTAWETDPAVASKAAERQAYNSANGITETSSTVEQ